MGVGKIRIFIKTMSHVATTTKPLYIAAPKLNNICDAKAWTLPNLVQNRPCE